MNNEQPTACNDVSDKLHIKTRFKNRSSPRWTTIEYLTCEALKITPLYSQFLFLLRFYITKPIAFISMNVFKVCSNKNRIVIRLWNLSTHCIFIQIVKWKIKNECMMQVKKTKRIRCISVLNWIWWTSALNWRKMN